MTPRTLHSRPAGNDTRRQLRRESTPAERALWQALRGRRLGGWRFRRQHGVGPYVLDFYCAEAHLAVELDGAPHFTPEGQTYDAERTAHLAAVGIRVVRFENRKVWDDPAAVLAAIRAALNAEPPPAATGSPR